MGGMDKGKITMIFLLELITPEPNSGCWLWLEKLDKDGYGEYRNDKAHRFIFRFYNPAVSIEKKLLHHRCRTKSCVNPDHMIVCENQGEHNKLHAKDNKARRKITLDIELQIIELYLNHKNLTLVAAITKLAPSAVSKVLHRNNIITPSRFYKSSSNFTRGPRRI